MSLDLVLEGNVYLKRRIVKACIGVENGKIKEIKKILKGAKNLDFGEKLIMPGGIDVHVHFREPGATHKEDFYTGTQAAAFGGVSCVLDMPNTLPEVTSVELFQAKLELVKKKSCVDFGLYANGISNEVPELAKICNGFKVYMHKADDVAIERSLSQLRKTAKPIAVHAEAKNLIKSEVAKNLQQWLSVRPAKAEVKAIQKLSSFDELHVCHISAKESLLALENTNLSSEVTLHHLLLNSSSELGALVKVTPPLRTGEDTEALWEALQAGKLDMVASDHAPHLLEEKKDFSEAPPGVPSVETTYPLLLYFVKARKIALARLVEAFCEKPAKLFKLKKGKIAPRYDADLIVADLKAVQKIKPKNLHSKCGWSPFENFSAIFPLWTFVRGEPVIEACEFVGEKGFGKFVSDKNV